MFEVLDNWRIINLVKKQGADNVDEEFQEQIIHNYINFMAEKIQNAPNSFKVAGQVVPRSKAFQVSLILYVQHTGSLRASLPGWRGTTILEECRPRKIGRHAYGDAISALHCLHPHLTSLAAGGHEGGPGNCELGAVLRRQGVHGLGGQAGQPFVRRSAGWRRVHRGAGAQWCP